jgi:hypothetical protein
MEKNYNDLLNSIVIKFNNNLILGQKYTLTISTNLKDIEGLNIKNNIVIRLYVGSNYSQFLKLDPDSIESMILDIQQNGESYSPIFISNDEGLSIEITLNNANDPLKFKIKFCFTNPGYGNEVPKIVTSSLVQSVFIKKIFPGTSTSIPILLYNFVADNECEIEFEINPADYNNSIIYIKISGGSSGVIDSYDNYLKESFMIYFKLIF